MHIILVHGTWAPGARWVRDGSTFRQALRSALGRDVTFEPSGWSGRNRDADRRAGAVALRDRVLAAHRDDPDRPIVLIGHSHGGTVIRHALGDPATAARVASVVTLATPFLIAEPRHTRRTFKFLLVMAHDLARFMLVGIAFGTIFAMRGLDRDALGTTIPALLLVLGTLPGLVTLLTARPTRRWFLRGAGWLYRIRRRTLLALAQPEVSGPPCLGLLARGDEVQTLMRTTDRVDALANTFYPLSVLRFMINSMRLVVALMAIGVTVYTLITDPRPPTAETIGSALAVCVTTVVIAPNDMKLAGSALFLSMHLLFYVPARWGSQRAVYGWPGALTNFLLRARRIKHPAGWSLRPVGPTAHWLGRLRLRHTLHAHPDTAPMIARWLCEKGIAPKPTART